MAVFSYFKLMRSVLSSTYIIQHLKLVNTSQRVSLNYYIYIYIYIYIYNNNMLLLFKYCSYNNDTDVFIGPIPRGD